MISAGDYFGGNGGATVSGSKALVVRGVEVDGGGARATGSTRSAGTNDPPAGDCVATRSDRARIGTRNNGAEATAKRAPGMRENPSATKISGDETCPTRGKPRRGSPQPGQVVEQGSLQP